MNETIKTFTSNEEVAKLTNVLIDQVEWWLSSLWEWLNTIPTYILDFYVRFQWALNHIDYFIIISTAIQMIMLSVWCIAAVKFMYWKIKVINKEMDEWLCRSDEEDAIFARWLLYTAITITIFGELLFNYALLWTIKEQYIKNILLKNTPEIRLLMEIEEVRSNGSL